MTMKKLLLNAMMLSGLIGSSYGQTVTSGGDDGSPGTLRSEVNDASSGDTIMISNTVVTITLDSAITIDKELTIMGSNSVLLPIIDVDENGRVFTISDGPVELQNLSFVNGLEEDGGAIFISDADMTGDNLSFANNVANGSSGSGGAIYVSDESSLTISNSTFSQNRANRAGGAIEVDAGDMLGLTCTDVTFTANNAGVSPATAAPGNGGAIHVTGSSDIMITDGSASNNQAALEGGAFWIGSGMMTIDGTTFTSNNANGDMANEGGGALFNAGGTLIVSNATLTSNSVSGSSASGGAILSDLGDLYITNTTLSNNIAVRAGGAIEFNSEEGDSLALINCEILENEAGNSPGNGGGLHITGPGNSFINGGTVSDNIATAEGGGLWNGSGMMMVKKTMISENSALGTAADQGGAGIFNAGGTLVVDSAMIVDNEVDSASASGGGILSDLGNLFVSNTTFTGNVAIRAGGAIEFNSEAGDSLAVIDCIIDNNEAGDAPGNGGGIHITGAGNSLVSGGMVSNNVASLEGGGLWNGSGTMKVMGTSITGNTASGDAANEGGGGIFNAGGILIVDDVTISMNSVDGEKGSGGGILSDLGDLYIINTKISNNESIRAGGAIEFNSEEGDTLAIVNSVIDSNETSASPGNGGGLHITGAGNSLISESEINDNIAASEGGGLWNGSGTMIVSNCEVLNNVASGDAADNGGGGIFNAGGTLLVDDSEISSNIADGASGSGGGILNDKGTLSVSNSEFMMNEAMRAGGAIEDNSVEDAELIVNDVVFENNSVGSAPGNGGALHITGPGNSTLTSIEAVGNTAGSEGGAIWNNTGTMNIIDYIAEDNIASGNDADNGGGGLYNNGGDVNLFDALFDGNLADGVSGSGGAILSTDGTIVIDSVLFEENGANRAGGAIEIVDGTLNIDNASFEMNDANGLAGTPNPGSGGAIHITGKSTISMINDSYFGQNEAALTGGALWNQDSSTMNISLTTIEDNTASGGGGVYNTGGMVNIQTSTISSNTASNGPGGGILNASGMLDVMTSTISGNTTSMNGGGIQNNGSATINAVTIAANSADSIGGGIMAVDEVMITNTLIGNNTATDGNADIAGMITSNDYNLVQDNSGSVMTTMANDIVDVDPMIGSLQDNGGETETHALLAGSPAINEGNSADTFSDQLGNSIVGVRDIGAFEAGVTTSINNPELVHESSLYPNPAVGQFTIALESAITENVELTLMNVSGQVVQKIKFPTGTTQMNVNESTPGMYIINIQGETTQITHLVEIAQ